VVGFGTSGMGIDNILTGISNIQSGQHNKSVFEFGVYRVTGNETASLVVPMLTSFATTTWGLWKIGRARWVVEGNGVNDFANSGKSVQTSFPSNLIPDSSLSISMNRGIGNLGGYIVPVEYIDDLRSTLEAIKLTRTGERIELTIETFERGAAGNARALYHAERTGSVHGGAVRIPQNATYYEFLHELQHAFHHVESGRDFFRMTEAARELEVYHRLLESPYWHTFTPSEMIDAYRQIMRASNLRGS